MQLGVPNPIENRKVLITVPDNVWFRLNRLGFIPNDVSIEDCLSGTYEILLTKAMYGLVDAPLLWNLSFKAHLVLHMGAWVSHLDDNFYFFRDPETQVCLGNLSTHVDDTGVTGSQKSLDFWRTSIEEKFGKVTRQTLPFLWPFQTPVMLHPQPVMPLKEQWY